GNFGCTQAGRHIVPVPRRSIWISFIKLPPVRHHLYNERQIYWLHPIEKGIQHPPAVELEHPVPISKPVICPVKWQVEVNFSQVRSCCGAKAFYKKMLNDRCYGINTEYLILS